MKEDKHPLKSKKWLAMIIGISCAIFVYLFSNCLMIFMPEISSAVVSLSNLTISFIGMIITSLVVGQSAVDWKLNTKIENSFENKKIFTEKEEKKIFEMKYTK